MNVPVQITFRRMDSSPALEARVRELAAHLEKFSALILRVHVVIEGPPGHHRKGAHYDVGVEVSVPGRQIVIQRTPAQDPRRADAYKELADAFRAARRVLQDYARERRHEVKRHEVRA